MDKIDREIDRIREIEYSNERERTEKKEEIRERERDIGNGTRGEHASHRYKINTFFSLHAGSLTTIAK